MDMIVWGAGAIGGITGGALTRAGHDVLLVDIHEEHVAALTRDGLSVEDARGDWQVPVKAATPPEVRGPLRLVLLAVKAQATSAALDQIVPHLTDASVVVSVQNGLNEELIAERIGAARTIGCLVNWAADWIAPGRIRFGGTGSFRLGELDGRITPRVRELADILAVVQPTTVTENIWGCLWAKTCLAALLFATALTDETVYDVVERPVPTQRMLVLLVAEAMAVAEAAGVRLVAFDEYDPKIHDAIMGPVEEFLTGDTSPGYQEAPVGGAFVLVQMADMCVASETTRFIYPEGKIGTTAGGISSVMARMPQLTSWMPVPKSRLRTKVSTGVPR